MAKKTSKRFNSEKSANSFAKKVKGEVRDLRAHENRKSDFKVVYTTSKKSNFSSGYQFGGECDGHTFGYPDWYWQD